MQLDFKKLSRLERQRIQLEALTSSLNGDLTTARMDTDAKSRALASYFSSGVTCPPEIREQWHELRFDPEAVLPLAQKHDLPALASLAQSVIAAKRLQSEISTELQAARERFNAAAAPLARLNEFVRRNDPNQIHGESF